MHSHSMVTPLGIVFISITNYRAKEQMIHLERTLVDEVPLSQNDPLKTAFASQRILI